MRTALTDETENAFLIVECADPARVEDRRAATDELAELVERYLGATIAVKELVASEDREVVIAEQCAGKAPGPGTRASPGPPCSD